MMIVTAVGCLIAFGYFISTLPENEPFEFSLLVSDAAGLDVDDAIVMRGLKVGKVIAASLKDEGVLITLRMDLKNRPFVDTRLRAWVEENALGSNEKQLHLAPGQPPGQLIQWDAVLKRSWSSPKQLDERQQTTVSEPVQRKPLKAKDEGHDQVNQTASAMGQSTTPTRPAAVLAKDSQIVPVETPSATRWFRLVIHKFNVAESKLNGKPWDLFGGPPDLQVSAWCGDKMLLISPKYDDVYAMTFDERGFASQPFQWPAGQSVGLKLVDRDVRHDDKIGAVNLPYQARSLQSSKRFVLRGSSIMTIEVSLQPGVE